ncbi:MAG: transposase [Actinobacteria bacterium]|nr:transposase [Actinomycetota bacterium]
MPSRNQRKSHAAVDRLFHVYNRGIDRLAIFQDAVDQREFLQCFRRYLSPEPFRDDHFRPYRKLSDQVAVAAYCLMPNHFHLIVHQIQEGGMAKLMHGALSGYVSSYNRRHGRSGRLFEAPYKAAEIVSHGQAKRAIAYVHNNHPIGPDYELCTHPLYRGKAQSDWIAVETGLRVFGGVDHYSDYMDRYVASKSAEPLSAAGFDSLRIH